MWAAVTQTLQTWGYYSYAQLYRDAARCESRCSHDTLTLTLKAKVLAVMMDDSVFSLRVHLTYSGVAHILHLKLRHQI